MYLDTAQQKAGGIEWVFYSSIHDHVSEATWGAFTWNNNIYYSPLYSDRQFEEDHDGSAPFPTISYATRKAKTGFDSVSKTTDNPTLHTNYQLLPGSPAIDAGTDLSAYFTDDYAGRPRSGTWEIGSYEYLTGVTFDGVTFN